MKGKFFSNAASPTHSHRSSSTTLASQLYRWCRKKMAISSLFISYCTCSPKYVMVDVLGLRNAASHCVSCLSEPDMVSRARSISWSWKELACSASIDGAAADAIVLERADGVVDDADEEFRIISSDGICKIQLTTRSAQWSAQSQCRNHSR